MPRHSLANRAFFCAVSILFLTLGVYLVVDSAENQGFAFGSSFRVLMLAIVTVLGFIHVLRGQGDKQPDDETRAEEL